DACRGACELTVMKLRFLFLWFGFVAAGAQAADFPGTIVLGRPTNNSIAANLLAPAALSAYLEFGPQSGAYPGQIDAIALAANVPQEVTIPGLAANRRYFYGIRFCAKIGRA